MCNLYSMTSNQRAILGLTRANRDTTGNLPPLPSIFPDTMAPVVWQAEDGERELTIMRWGMPGPAQSSGAPVTNIRNTRSPHWRRWLSPAHRCLVPVTSFCEWEDTMPKKTPVWFALSAERPLVAFAGIWTTWTGVRGTKANPVDGEHKLYGFLTCDPNGVVGPIHPKAMPVLLATPDEMDTWLEAPWEIARELQRPLPDADMLIVSKGNRQDSGVA
ncbi:SOS response-associated peptidase [Belnapia sp. F-4-1]|uniref:SOS response-associated peptidase n=1 Tax=Belnapia sp. F-4-1 TaxID=1545443 RepID=UPI0005B84366|nr:SOS response-associated peptidase [Belnapia sp. F-4-1]